jgi:hypothetical protein
VSRRLSQEDRESKASLGYTGDTDSKIIKIFLNKKERMEVSKRLSFIIGCF